MNATTSYNALHELLTDKQRTAIDALVAGGTHAEAAEAAGVHRVTVSRWVTKVPKFEAVLNQRRAELLSRRADLIRSLDSKALTIMAAQVEEGDPEVAIQWLRLRRIGAVSVDAIGPTDPENVVEAEVEERMKSAVEARRKRLTDDPDLWSRDDLREDIWEEAHAADVEDE